MIRLGNTGIMMPKPIVSISRVTKMKPIAACLLDFIAGKAQDKVLQDYTKRNFSAQGL
jgi:hypothetical protein